MGNWTYFCDCIYRCGTLLIFEAIQERGKRDGGSDGQVSDLEHGDAVPVITVHASFNSLCNIS